MLSDLTTFWWSILLCCASFPRLLRTHADKKVAVDGKKWDVYSMSIVFAFVFTGKEVSRTNHQPTLLDDLSCLYLNFEPE